MHRWLGLIAAVLWLLQALTGMFAVFHWEIDDAITAGAHRATDLGAIERKVTVLAPIDIWSTAGAPDRYDVNVTGRVIRIDGTGNVLRIRRDDEMFAHGGIVDTLVRLHQSLLADDAGKWVTGTSGVLLLSNLIFGIIAAWPRAGQWKQALQPSRSSSRVASLYSWHRAAGLWLAIPALCLVTAGALLAFEDGTERLLHAAPTEPPPQPSSAPQRVGMAAAAESALVRYPGAVVSGIRFPTPENAVWKITLKQRGELQRAYGKTRVFVSAIDGRVIADFDALRAPATRWFLNHLFAFHTGEIAGTAGRIAVLVFGVWLIAMIVLGIALWSARRAVRTSKSRA